MAGVAFRIEMFPAKLANGVSVYDRCKVFLTDTHLWAYIETRHDPQPVQVVDLEVSSWQPGSRSEPARIQTVEEGEWTLEAGGDCGCHTIMKRWRPDWAGGAALQGT